MDKLEKVIQALENCTAEIKCRDCPWDECEGQHEHVELPKGLALKTLELLKAQEPIPCGEKIKAGDIVLDFYECGYCKNAIRKPWRYCPFCGNEVKWNGFDRKTLV